MSLFRGSGTALITPFRQSEGIDYDAFGKIIDFQLAGKSDALVVTGTTGEASTLSDEERARALEFVVQRTAGRVPVIAGTGSNETAHSVKISREAQSLGADGLLVVTPYYNKTSASGLIAHYTAIADAVDIPIIIYNVPSRTGLNMKPESIAALSSHPNIQGVKEASGDMAQVVELCRLCADKLAIYSGIDEIVLPLLSCGGQGIITTVGNITPLEMHLLCEMYFNSDIEGARKMQFQLKPLIDALFTETNPIPVKKAAQLMGLCDGSLRLPLVEISDTPGKLLKQRMQEASLI
jgi:4-hydroxy-tetrahydrodipicolinate synthase